MSCDLTSKQRDWVAEEVQKGYEGSEWVCRGTEGEGVPHFPSRDAVVDSVQAALTREQASFMRRRDKPGFSFIAKLAVPAFKRDLLTTLVSEQTRLAKLTVNEDIMTQMQEAPSRVSEPTWYWEFGQGSRLLLRPQKLDKAHLPLRERLAEFKASLPEGMKGMDLSAWAVRTALGLSIQLPFDTTGSDILFGKRAVRSNITLIDELGELDHMGGKYIPAATFRSGYGDILLGSCKADEKFSEAIRLRASVDGPIAS